MIYPVVGVIRPFYPASDIECLIERPIGIQSDQVVYAVSAKGVEYTTHQDLPAWQHFDILKIEVMRIGGEPVCSIKGIVERSVVVQADQIQPGGTIEFGEVPSYQDFPIRLQCDRCDAVVEPGPL